MTTVFADMTSDAICALMLLMPAAVVESSMQSVSLNVGENRWQKY